MHLSEGIFILPRPGGYGVDLSFFPGTSLSDVPYSLIKEMALKILPEEDMEEIKRLEARIGETRGLLSQLPAVTLDQQLRRLDPEVQLEVLSGSFWAYLVAPREEAAEQLAQIACNHYRKWLDGQLATFKKSLPQTKYPDIGAYFQKQVGDPRYFGYTFNNLVPPEEVGQAELSIKRALLDIYSQKVPAGLQKYVTYQVQNYLFALPKADYSLDNVPCLDFGFDLYLVVEMEFTETKKANGTFYGCERIISFTGDILGRLYTIIQPNPSYSFWQSIPVVLLQGLLKGKQEPPGVTISGACEGGTDYLVKGYDDTITIPDHFSLYLKEIGDISRLEKMGIIGKKVGGILGSKVCQPTGVKSGIVPADKHDAGFNHEDFISSLAGLGIGKKYAEKLFNLTPKDMSLKEAINHAMKLYGEMAGT